MTPQEQREWLLGHIPYRIRAVLPGIPMKAPWLVQVEPTIMQPRPFPNHCVWAALHEGRLAAMRWLIEFVGIKEKEGHAVNSKSRSPRVTDAYIDAFPGGILFTPSRVDAQILASLWKGCSQASGHATHGTNHPDVSDRRLAEALTVIIAHLEQTIYRANGINLFDAVHRL